MMNYAVLLRFALALILAAPVLAQDEDEKPPEAKPQSEIDKMIEAGQLSAVEARLRSGSPDDLLKVAQAARNAARLGARRERDPARREKAFQDAEKRFLKAIEAADKAREGDALKRAVDRVRARLELGGMILANWVAPELDKWELSNGKVGDRKDLLAKLGRAREQYATAGSLITPLFQERHQREDELLALNLFEDVRRFKLDSDFNLAFCCLYIGQVAEKDSKERNEALGVAEKKFRELVDSGTTGSEMYQIYLGLGIALRELNKNEEAIRQLRLAMDEGSSVAVAMQARYETARALMQEEKFNEARTMLDPLVSKDLDNLTKDEATGRFYLHLSKIWDANSYLLEAQVLRRTAENSPARNAILNSSKQAYEMGLSKMNRLAAMGDPWPGVVKLYVADAIKTNADPKTMTVVELKMAAGKLSDEKKHKAALPLLTEALSRSGTDPALAADLMYDLAICHYQMDDLRSAAQVFDKLATTHKTHEKGPKAAEFAYKCWARLAEEGKSKEDYARLAETLQRLITDFPNHESRKEAEWFLPLALQAAGKYDPALKHYSAIPRESPRFEEAQYRKAICTRLAITAKRESLSAEEFNLEARKAARQMREYADESLTRAASADNKTLLNWSAEVRVSAAELLTEPGVERHADALETMNDFEKRYGGSDMLGRVLAARIKAYRGQRDFEAASRVLQEYLQTVPPEKAGAVLAGLAKSMQDEIDSLQQAGQTEQAQKMAAEAVDVFDQLFKTIGADEKRADQREVVQYGLARMLYLAGQLDRSDQLVAELMARNPKNGNYQRLYAQLLTARTSAQSSPDQLKTAQDAWAALLKDDSLRKRAPELYWEARYNWLSLHFRLGNAADVHKAITQERVWYPDLGGSPWRQKLEALREEAAKTAGISEEEATTQPAPTG